MAAQRGWKLKKGFSTVFGEYIARRCTRVYAIIETGGKQYKVAEGDVIFVEKLGVAAGESYVFDKVMAVSKDDAMTIGAPYVEGAKVAASVIEEGKEKKVVIYKYKSKKGFHKKRGHRQPFTRVKIETITL